jgi:hypothetical protein
MREFPEFPKIARLSRGCVITEKIDGTNASVFIDAERLCDDGLEEGAVAQVGGLTIYAGSRTRWITPAADNFGFAAWVKAHAEELVTLGPGHHYGEWWGSGVQRGYGFKDGKRTFSLFNTARWDYTTKDREKYPTDRPLCCDCVPVLYCGPFVSSAVETALEYLRAKGSVAAPGFARPEGVVIYHEASRTLFKKTLEKDEEPKGLRA